MQAIGNREPPIAREEAFLSIIFITEKQTVKEKKEKQILLEVPKIIERKKRTWTGKGNQLDRLPMKR